MGKDRDMLHLPVPGREGEYVDVEREPAKVASDGSFPGETEDLRSLSLPGDVRAIVAGVLAKEIKHSDLLSRLPASWSSF